MLLASNKGGFSIIEILIGMFIFTLGIISIYAVLSSSVRLNQYNKNYIIATNLAREQLELMRNNRDYNYQKLQKFDQINPPLIGQLNPADNYSNVFVNGGYYKIENNINTTANFPIKVTQLSAGEFANDQNYQLCRDTNNMYIYCPISGGERTQFFKYIYVDRTLGASQLKVTSKVIWKDRGVHEFEVKTILTDWKQL